jgi:stringent starvation protein A
VVTANTLNLTLYASVIDIDSHYVRLVLSEKGLLINIVDVETQSLPEDLRHLTPYQSLPILLDRDAALYETRTIVEYIDERFPHPPLLAANPSGRAKTKLLCYRIFRDWFSLADKIAKTHDQASNAQYARELADSLTSVSAIFAQQTFFLHEQYSLADCALSVLLWRLPLLGVTLPIQAKPIVQYAKRMFEREAFKLSLTNQEQRLSQSWGISL